MKTPSLHGISSIRTPPQPLGLPSSGWRTRLAVSALALVLATASGLVLAYTGGGGHGGGAHFGGGHFGGGSSAGGARGGLRGSPHFGGGVSTYRAGPRFSYGARSGFNGGYVAGRGSYGGRANLAPARSGALTARTGVARAPIANGRFSGGSARGGYRGYPGHAGGGGFHHHPWNGGYWRGCYWPAVYYGADFAWFMPVLPAYCAAYWWGGIPYYYYDDAYYTWDAGDGGYVATEPPPVADDAAVGPDDASPPSGQPVDPSVAPPDTAMPSGGPPSGADTSGNLYAYPKNGQSSAQQAQDRMACAQWAASQAPETASGNSIDYQRALSACLTGRGYSVD